MKNKIILIPSKEMDKRDNHNLIRLPSQTREHMGLNVVDDDIELWKARGKKATIVLNVYRAFMTDIKGVRDKINDDDLKKVGFVSTETFNKLVSKDQEMANDIWIAKPNHDLMYGADPEFLLFKEGNVVKASNVLSHSGLFGSDGAMAEIRPYPNENITTLVENMRNIFANASPSMKEYDWMSCCYFKDSNRDYPVGGHIHVGDTVKVSKMSREDKMIIFRDINKILDELLAIPMMKLDGSEAGSARRTKCSMGNYGFFGEFRFSGENSHFEYRTLSGMWLIHPIVAETVIGTAKTIVDEVYKLITKNKYDTKYTNSTSMNGINPWASSNDNLWKTIPLMEDMGCIKSSKEMRDTLNQSITENINKEYLEQWYSRMKQLSTYNDSKDYIDNLYKILQIPEKQFNKYNKEIKTNWLGDNKFILD